MKVCSLLTTGRGWVFGGVVIITSVPIRDIRARITVLGTLERRGGRGDNVENELARRMARREECTQLCGQEQPRFSYISRCFLDSESFAIIILLT